MKVKMNALAWRRVTLADAIRSGGHKKVLLRFWHGLGDAVDFYNNCLPELRAEFPDVEFAFETWKGQPEMFGEVDADEDHYDLAVAFVFPCSEWEPGPETKAEKCGRVELGIPIVQRDVYRNPKTFGSPLVGVHFFNTSSADVSANEPVCRMVWDCIVERGLIPIDTHFEHPDAFIKHVQYDWEDRTVCGVEPKISKLFGLIGSCGGFAGVSGGNFWTSLTLLPPEVILYIETAFPAEKLTRLPVHHVKTADDRDAVMRWLDCVEKRIAVKETR